MRELLTDIFTWPWFSEPHGYNFNGHFIRHAGRNLCVDPVEPSEEDLAELARHVKVAAHVQLVRWMTS